jgi:hypothetical protein
VIVWRVRDVERGHTVFARMPCAPKSSAIDLVVWGRNFGNQIRASSTER